jgi:hypothetical protein
MYPGVLLSHPVSKNREKDGAWMRWGKGIEYLLSAR